MKLYSYLKDKSLSIILHLLGDLSVSFYIITLGNSPDAAILLSIGWSFVVTIYYSIDYRLRRRYFNSVLSCLDNLEQKYLISDVVEGPRRLEDVIYHRILHKGNKAMLEKISEIRHECSDYIEYVEQWVHEIKTPLSAMKLICDNNRTEETRKVLKELERANRYVEQVLFYARSENVEKDYIIRETSLTDIVTKSIHNNRQLLREENIMLKLECEHQVFTDSKWIVFIIDQCIINSVKYGAKQISFECSAVGSKTYFSITDDGIGILEEDLPRIFEKGFTGKNGRNQDKSTGLGLYLCKKLCDKLDIGLIAESVTGSFTKITLVFTTGRLEN